jgi:hypothetical protein
MLHLELIGYYAAEQFGKPGVKIKPVSIAATEKD